VGERETLNQETATPCLKLAQSKLQEVPNLITLWQKLTRSGILPIA
jgi:hypothetical protein